MPTALRLCALFLLPALCVLSPAQAQDASWQDRVDPQLLATVLGGTPAQALVEFAGQADLSAAAQQPGLAERRRFVVETLQRQSEEAQQAARRLLDAMAVPYRAFWVANALSLTADAASLQALAELDGVDYIHGVRPSVIDLPQAELSAAEAQVQRGLDVIRAREVWALGFRGQGVVVAGHDTGVEWEHPALIGKYRGWDGAVADHDYNWRNPLGEQDVFCADPAEPCDVHFHGTHTAGTMVGDDGQGNVIGVAPGARWIACRSLYDGIVGLGYPNTYLDCMEWTLAPYPIEQPELADPAMAPDIVNNSWGCVEGCPPNLLKAANDAVKYAGILQVVSAGNDGNLVGCSSIAFPLAIYESSFTIGATNYDDQLAGFSSLGPVLSDLSMRTKPNVVAPGVGVRSSTLNGGYGTASGTSMAGPHVAGAAALIMSAEPRMIGRVDDVRRLFQRTAVPIENGRSCGDTGAQDIPNNVFGHGRIDVMAALDALPRLALDVETLGASGDGAPWTHRLLVRHAETSRLDATGLRVTLTLPQGTALLASSVAGADSHAGDGSAIVRVRHERLAPGKTWIAELQLGGRPSAIAATVEADQVSPVQGRIYGAPAAGRDAALPAVRGGGAPALLLLLAALAQGLRRRRS